VFWCFKIDQEPWFAEQKKSHVLELKVTFGDRSKEVATDNCLMVNMGVEPRTLALLAPRSKPTELIDRCYQVA
jgi:hypothetical protein